MIHVVLYQPEIPSNTGNIIRLCANSGAALHLVSPLGFAMDDRRLRRAGLDYHEWVRVREHGGLEQCLEAIAPEVSAPGADLFALSTRGRRNYADVSYGGDTVLLFGPETRGLPDSILDGLTPDQCLRIPMAPQSRSLNLSNAVAIAVYEVWRQQGFDGA